MRLGQFERSYEMIHGEIPFLCARKINYLIEMNGGAQKKHIAEIHT